MAEWKKIQIASMFSGINPLMLQGLKTALEMSVQSMEVQVKSIETYIEKMIDPLVVVMEKKVEELEEKLKAFNVEVGFQAFDIIFGNDGGQTICEIFDSAQFIDEENISGGILLMVKAAFKKEFENQMESLNAIFNRTDELNKWNVRKLGFCMPFFDPDDPASIALKITGKFKEFLIKLKEKKDTMIEFVKNELEPHIIDVKIKIDEIEKILKAIKDTGLYKISFEGIKGKKKLLEEIRNSFEIKNEDDKSNIPDIRKNEAAAGIVLLLSEGEDAYNKASDIFKKIIKI